MSERRVPRLLLELAFLAALAAALAFADLRPAGVGAFMLGGWVCVALFEWGALRGRPHYGRGLPPRWYVPRAELPPPRPLEQFVAGYPAAGSGADEATWIAPAALHADWPLAGEETSAGEPAPAEPEPAPAAAGQRAAPAAEAAATAPGWPARQPGPEPEVEAGPAPEPAPAAAPAPPRAPAPPSARRARHRIDPLADPAARRAGRLGRRRPEEPAWVEVPWRPQGPRPLPGARRAEP